MSAGMLRSIARIGWLAAHAWRMAVRDRVVFGCAGVCAACIIAGLELRRLHFAGSSAQPVIEFGFASIALFGAIVAIVATSHQFHVPLENGLAGSVLAKPVRRAEYLLGQWLGVCGVLAVFCAVTTALILGVAVGAPDPESSLTATPSAAPSWLALLRSGSMQAVKLGLLSAMTLLIASTSRSAPFTILMSSLLAVLAYLRPVVVDFQPYATTLVGQGAAFVVGLLPDLGQFDAGASGGAVSSMRLVGYAAIYASGCVAAAAVFFGRRDL